MSTNFNVVAKNPSELQSFLKKAEGTFAAALPKHLTPERMMRLIVTQFSQNPALRKCSVQSIIASSVLASQLGLEIGVMGQAYLVPYGSTCTFIPGWQGLVTLVQNSGRADVWTNAVYEGDVFRYQMGSEPKIVHEAGPNFGNEDKLIWAYAVAKVKGSERPIIEAWPIERIRGHLKKHNKVGGAHYAHKNFEMYARKVVLLQVLKYVPRSIELDSAMQANYAAEEGKQVKFEDGVILEVESVEEDFEAAQPQKKTETKQIPAPEANVAASLDTLI
jgi:recombination protein RecT